MILCCIGLQSPIIWLENYDFWFIEKSLIKQSKNLLNPWIKSQFTCPDSQIVQFSVESSLQFESNSHEVVVPCLNEYHSHPWNSLQSWRHSLPDVAFVWSSRLLLMQIPLMLHSWADINDIPIRNTKISILEKQLKIYYLRYCGVYFLCQWDANQN